MRYIFTDLDLSSFYLEPVSILLVDDLIMQIQKRSNFMIFHPLIISSDDIALKFSVLKMRTQTNLKQPNDHDAEPHANADSNTWDLAGVTLFRTLGYVVGLPSFIVGTAVFMLGFAVIDTDILNVACILYSLALVSIGGRPVLLRLNPQNEIQALKVASLSILAGALFYGLLLALLTAIGFDMF